MNQSATSRRSAYWAKRKCANSPTSATALFGNSCGRSASHWGLPLLARPCGGPTMSMSGCEISSRANTRRCDMNRKERRAAKSKKRHQDFYERHVKHLPIIPIGAPLERGKVYHFVTHHDSWCAFYEGGDCNCNPIFMRH